MRWRVGFRSLPAVFDLSIDDLATMLEGDGLGVTEARHRNVLQEVDAGPHVVIEGKVSELRTLVEVPFIIKENRGIPPAETPSALAAEIDLVDWTAPAVSLRNPSRRKRASGNLRLRCLDIASAYRGL